MQVLSSSLTCVGKQRMILHELTFHSALGHSLFLSSKYSRRDSRYGNVTAVTSQVQTCFCSLTISHTDVMNFNCFLPYSSLLPLALLLKYFFSTTSAFLSRCVWVAEFNKGCLSKNGWSNIYWSCRWTKKYPPSHTQWLTAHINMRDQCSCLSLFPSSVKMLGG